MFTVWHPKECVVDIWFPGGVWQIARCSMQLFQFTFSHFTEGVKHLLGSETLSHESWKKCQDDNITNRNCSEWGVASHQLFSHILSSFVLVKDQIAHPSGIIEVQGGVREHFYVLLIPLTVHQWSPESQLRPSDDWSLSGRLPRARTWKSQGVDHVCSSLFLSQANTNSLLNSMALLAFHFPFGKLN